MNFLHAYNLRHGNEILMKIPHSFLSHYLATIFSVSRAIIIVRPETLEVKKSDQKS